MAFHAPCLPLENPVGGIYIAALRTSNGPLVVAMAAVLALAAT